MKWGETGEELLFKCVIGVCAKIQGAKLEECEHIIGASSSSPPRSKSLHPHTLLGGKNLEKEPCGWGKGKNKTTIDLIWVAACSLLESSEVWLA